MLSVLFFCFDSIGVGGSTSTFFPLVLGPFFPFPFKGYVTPFSTCHRPKLLQDVDSLLLTIYEISYLLLSIPPPISPTLPIIRFFLFYSFTFLVLYICLFICSKVLVVNRSVLYNIANYFVFETWIL